MAKKPDDKFKHAKENARGWLASIEEMLDELAKAEAQDDGSELAAQDAIEKARQRIEESVLSVQVRDGWHNPGAPSEDGPEEYEILLSTGGPALRIFGKLDCCSPETAEMQMQDWFTPWTRYDKAPEETLLKFVQIFWFGE